MGGKAARERRLERRAEEQAKNPPPPEVRGGFFRTGETVRKRREMYWDKAMRPPKETE